MSVVGSGFLKLQELASFRELPDSGISASAQSITSSHHITHAIWLIGSATERTHEIQGLSQFARVKSEPFIKSVVQSLLDSFAVSGQMAATGV